MYKIVSGTQTAVSLFATADLPIDTTSTFYEVSVGADLGIDAVVIVLIGNVRAALDGGGTVTVDLNIQDPTIENWYLFDSKTYSGGETHIRTEFRIGLFDGMDVKVTVNSTDANDTSVQCNSFLYSTEPTMDAAGRIDVGNIIGTPPTLGGAGSDKLDVNVNDWNDVDAKSSASDLPQVDVVTIGDETPTAVTQDTADKTKSFMDKH